jgi:mediator of RNA polymerase II transcription subunit 31
MLAEELGYEDQEEFEDALKSSFAEFIGALPHIETRNMESELQPGLFRDVFRVIPDPPAEQCTPQRLVLKIESSSGSVAHSDAPPWCVRGDPRAGV